MSIEAMKIISDMMNTLDIPYAFMEWTKKPPAMYFVGEYQEVGSVTKEEDGNQDSTFLLTGFTRGTWLSLEQAKQKIEKALPKKAITESGSAVAIFYGNTLVVPTGDAELKRIQINLTIKEWGK